MPGIKQEMEPFPQTYEQFQTLTETGKFKAVTNAMQQVERMDNLMGQLGNIMFGALMLLEGKDRVKARLARYEEKHS